MYSQGGYTGSLAVPQRQTVLRVRTGGLQQLIVRLEQFVLLRVLRLEYLRRHAIAVEYRRVEARDDSTQSGVIVDETQPAGDLDEEVREPRPHLRLVVAKN